jgi:hypothetical protein
VALNTKAAALHPLPSLKLDLGAITHFSAAKGFE